MLTLSSWTIAAEYHASPAAQSFASLDLVFALKGQLITSSFLSDIIRVEIEGTGYFVKRYTAGGRWLRRYIGRSRIRAEWENMLLFHKLNIPAANVTAYGQETFMGVMQRGALITEEVADARDLTYIAC